MKNLITIGIDKLQDLPIELLSHNLQKKHWRARYHKYRFNNYHKIDDRSPFDIAEDIIKKHIGKSYNDAYSAYCKKTKWYQKDIFKDHFNSHYILYRWNNYIVDDDGLIQLIKIKEYQGPYRFDSIDAVWERRHKITGKKEPEYSWHKKNYKHSDYENVLIKGWIKYFKSKEDPEYKRLTHEKFKAQQRAFKLKMKAAAEKAYSFISQSELELKKEKEKNNIKILAHGFDLVTSFRTEKQTNPDLIHLKQ